MWHDSDRLSTQSCDRHNTGLAVSFAMMATIMPDAVLTDIARDALAISSSRRSHLDRATNL